jgi:hypothetical protein
LGENKIHLLKLVYRLLASKQNRSHLSIFALLIAFSSLLGATTVSAEDINGLLYTPNSPDDGEQQYCV